MTDYRTNSNYDFNLENLMNDNYTLLSDPTALQDVINAHIAYDEPNTPLVLSLALIETGPEDATYGDYE
jgi:hypothetical protein